MTRIGYFRHPDAEGNDVRFALRKPLTPAPRDAETMAAKLKAAPPARLKPAERLKP